MSNTMQPDPIEGGLWRHYKGGLYRVICRARKKDDGVPFLAYQDIGTGRIYTRPEHEFRDLVQHPTTGLTMLRFTRVDDGLRPAAEVWTDGQQTEIPLFPAHHPV